MGFPNKAFGLAGDFCGKDTTFVEAISSSSLRAFFSISQAVLSYGHVCKL